MALGYFGHELVQFPVYTTDRPSLAPLRLDQIPRLSKDLTITADAERLESPATCAPRLRVSVKVQILSQVYCFYLVYFKYSFTLYYVR